MQYFPLNWARALHEGHTPCTILTQKSWKSWLSNDGRQISEFKVVFKKITKTLAKFSSKILGMQKSKFPSVIWANWLCSWRRLFSSTLKCAESTRCHIFFKYFSVTLTHHKREFLWRGFEYKLSKNANLSQWHMLWIQ